MRPTNHDVPAMDQINLTSPISSGSKCYSTTATATATAATATDNDDDNNDDNDPATPKFTVVP